MISSLFAAAAGFSIVLSSFAATFEAKASDRPLPEQLSASLKNKIQPAGVELRRGDVVCGYFHPVKTITTAATDEQIKNGLTIDDLPGSQLAGLVEWIQEMRDYRNQAIPAGIYTLRLGCQPESDDHRDTAPGRFFFVLCPLAKETEEDPTDLKALLERGKIGERKHPSPWFAFLAKPDQADQAKILSTPAKHESLVWPQEVRKGDVKSKIVLGWTIHGPAND